jgi:hypothetical protein
VGIAVFCGFMLIIVDHVPTEIAGVLAFVGLFAMPFSFMFLFAKWFGRG